MIPTWARSAVRKTPLAPLYAYFANRRRRQRLQRAFAHWGADEERRLGFYRQFISPGDLVFDVGANTGNRTKVFAKIGATVIAIEPQPACADFLADAFGSIPNVVLVRAALGAAPGRAELGLSDTTELASMSQNWMAAVTASGRFRGERWSDSVTVDVVTLDHLIATYGRPSFVKIDVEGFESQVLAGLSSAVRALSFELTPEYLDNALACIDRLAALGPVRFQLSVGESMQFRLPDWVDADALRQAVRALPATDFGDVYARFPV